jgi:hypothetical protein
MIILLVIIIIALFTVGGIGLATNGFSSFGSPKTTALPTTSAPTTTYSAPTSAAPTTSALPTATISTIVSAADLANAYKSDQVAAAAKYGGPYIVTGVVLSKTYDTSSFIVLKGDDAGVITIECILNSNSAAEQIGDIVEGETVKMQGVLSGMNEDGTMILVRNCKRVQ